MEVLNHNMLPGCMFSYIRHIVIVMKHMHRVTSISYFVTSDNNYAKCLIS